MTNLEKMIIDLIEERLIRDADIRTNALESISKLEKVAITYNVLKGDEKVSIVNNLDKTIVIIENFTKGMLYIYYVADMVTDKDVVDFIADKSIMLDPSMSGY